MMPVELLNNWGGAWLGLMTRTLLETSVLLGLMLVVWLPLRRRMSAQLAHGLFCLVLLKLVVPVPLTGSVWQPLSLARQAAERVSAWSLPGEPPAATAITESPPAPWSLPATGDVGAGLADAPSPQPVGTGEQSVSSALKSRVPAANTVVVRPPAPARLSFQAVLMLAWAGCVGVLLARFGRAMIRTRRLIRQAVPLPRGRLPIDVDSLRRAIGLRKSVRWAVDARLDSPAVGGLLRPAVIIPPDLNDSLTPNQLTWVLLHELAHVRRGDSLGGHFPAGHPGRLLLQPGGASGELDHRRAPRIRL